MVLLNTHLTCRNNASISNFGDGFRWQSEYPWCIIERSKLKFLRNIAKPQKFASNFIRKFNTKFFKGFLSKSYREKCCVSLNFKFLRNFVTITIYPQTVLRFFFINIDNIFLAESRYLKINYTFSHNSNINKIRQNHEYLQIVLNLKIYRTLNFGIVSESFFVYNDTDHWIQILHIHYSDLLYDREVHSIHHTYLLLYIRIKACMGV
ncbi:hypothetical protein AGLY_013705 [Aphis glycines]|uniref:Uncharacterized protein n=1 Tax=Aphis glycines TaxID=307491 RepID=A0A6G0T787_APHGL|nr:hypothetical protein AGLY_013705 [Aphis glycines]